MTLFLEPQSSFSPLEKKAAHTPLALSEDESKWVQDITSEVYRQFPFLANYMVVVEINRADKKTGVGVGKVQISPPQLRPDIPPSGKVVFLPFVIRGLELAPLDIATDGQTYFPATQRRLESALSEPDLGVVGPDRREMPDTGSYVHDLIPPGRHTGGYPGAATMKIGSAQTNASLFDKLLDTAYPNHIQEMSRELQKSNHGVVLSQSVPVSIFKLAEWKPQQPVPGGLRVIAETLRPTVVQFSKVAHNRVRVTTANRHGFLKVAEDIPMQEAQQNLPPEPAQQMEQEGFATLPMELPVEIPPLPKQDPTTPITQTGDYTVFTPEGQRIVGWGTTDVFGWDGQPLHQTLFSNGVVSAFQEQIAGIQTGTGQLPPAQRRAVPQSTGFFVFRIDGKLQCFGPVMVQSVGRMPDGSVFYSCQDMMSGAPLSLQPIPEVLRPTPLGEGLYGIPQFFEFLNLGQPMELLQPAMILKVAESNLFKGANLFVRSDGHVFHIEGSHVETLSRKDTHELTKEAAHFLLVCGGVPPKHASQLLKIAAHVRGDIVPVAKSRPVRSYDKVETKAKEDAAKDCKPSMKRKVLVKEASHIAHYLQHPTRPQGPYRMSLLFPNHFKLAAPVLPHQETVDTILSLGMVNPQNTSIFLRQQPKLEEALSTLCLLLLFSRMGAPGVPEIALERCIDAFEEVVESIQRLPYMVN